MSPRITFEKELVTLCLHVEEMARQVEANYEALFDAFAKKDEEKLRRLEKVDKEINRKQREIESECLFLITKQQPVVGDLRLVTAGLKAVTDIERIGDHVADMAELLLRMDLKDLDKYSVHLAPMEESAKEMLHMAVNAFVNRDIQVARKVIDTDDVVDELFNRVKEDIVDALKREAKDADMCIDAMMLAKYLEKIGDHAVNIGEWTIFRETGNVNNIRIL